MHTVCIMSSNLFRIFVMALKEIFISMPAKLINFIINTKNQTVMALWQKHWSNTPSDPRMQLLIGEMGAKGYGIYWLLSEKIIACNEGAVLLPQLKLEMCSRKLYSKSVLQVINNYYLFETDDSGYVRLHPIPIGNMSAHMLHDLKSGKVEPMQTFIRNISETTPDSTYYNTRAGENQNNNNITCLTHESILNEHPKVKEVLGFFTTSTWCGYVLTLLDPKSFMWRQSTCLHSGYAMLLDRHWEDAVVAFIHHIIALDRADEIRSEQNVHYYFANFVNRYNNTGKKLMEMLKQQENGGKTIKPAPSFPGANNFEEIIGGKRYADGKPIPDDAPPRPSATAVWDAGGQCWTEL